MKNLLLTLIAFSFLFVANFEAFSQTTAKQKLVKCYEKSRIVYRVKCKSAKNRVVSKKKTTAKPFVTPDSDNTNASNRPENGVGGQGTGQGPRPQRGEGYGIGRGTGTGSGKNDESTTSAPSATKTTPPKILSIPGVTYTDQARVNQIQGTVILRVTFLADGTIGSIVPVSGLPYGLTEQAIIAAKLIKFKPAKRDGKPVTVKKQVHYPFTL